MTSPHATPQPAVAVDEMAFAITLFVAAANGRIAPPSIQSGGFSLGYERAQEPEPLLRGARTVLDESNVAASDEVPLACAVSVLWHHYDQDARREAICARLVAFYSLMVRSRGVLLEPWTEESGHDPKAVVLAPSIVEAVATASLHENGQFADVEFKELVRFFSARTGIPERQGQPPRAEAMPRKRKSSPLPVTQVAQELSKHLFAFQACVAKVPEIDGVPRFVVVEQLCATVGSMSGGTGLQAMLSRALLAGQSEFPWLSSVTAASSGAVEGLERILPRPDFHEAMKAEMAVLSSLIELLRSIVGDSVTLQLVRTLWPLASLDFEAHHQATIPESLKRAPD